MAPGCPLISLRHTSSHLLFSLQPGSIEISILPSFTACLGMERSSCANIRENAQRKEDTLTESYLNYSFKLLHLSVDLPLAGKAQLCCFSSSFHLCLASTWNLFSPKVQSNVNLRKIKTTKNILYEQRKVTFFIMCPL